jgi:hypothetical protein
MDIETSECIGKIQHVELTKLIINDKVRAGNISKQDSKISLVFHNTKRRKKYSNGGIINLIWSLLSLMYEMEVLISTSTRKSKLIIK